MKKIVLKLIGVMTVVFTFFAFVEKPVPSFDAEKPINRLILPKILQEVSGLTDLGPTTIACVQDELGIIFIYDFVKNEITEKIRFAEDGDYEGITRVGTSMFVLRSDGLLFKVRYPVQGEVKVEEFETDIPAKNNEALCFDKKNNRLLIGSKVKSGKGSNNNERIIYSFDLQAEKTESRPAFTLTKSEIIEFSEKNEIVLPTKKNKKTSKESVDLKLGISGISIHPKTNDLYVLCAIDYLMLVYSEGGELKSIEILDKKIHPQAEGITFYENGELFISNEGKAGEATLVKYQ